MANSNASTNGKAHNTSIEDLSEQIQKLKADLSDLTNTLGDFGSAKSEEAKKAAQAKAAELNEAGREKIAQAQVSTEEFVQNQPATALGIAAGVGFLIGMITTSRR